MVQVRFKNELERNITIKLGYANAKIYKCADPRCPRPACYKAYGSSKEDAPKCDVPGATRRCKLRGQSGGERSAGPAAGDAQSQAAAAVMLPLRIGAAQAAQPASFPSLVTPHPPPAPA